MTKAARQATIRDILSRQAITSQEDLRRALGKSGFKVTQATLSRDMKELGVSRLARGGGRFEYSIPAEPDLNDLRPIVGAEVMGIDANEYLIVVRTIPGAAHTVGEYIDIQQERDIIGTVAGDNTLLVIPSSAAKTRHVLAFLRRILGREG
ncbi:MAG: arginine repressor [bacterium]|jgi:transcriptional regulator of arginine metabolism|nr:arginine repressor [bacterium]MBK7771466.1 arginine repressor [bacterium]MBK9472180.1 arginine repressor [bacterium]MBK9777608.1 arginine repressor [bacterium]